MIPSLREGQGWVQKITEQENLLNKSARGGRARDAKTKNYQIDAPAAVL